VHQNRFLLGIRSRLRWGSLQRFPRSPSWISGGLLVKKGEGRGRKGEGKEKSMRVSLFPVPVPLHLAAAGDTAGPYAARGGGGRERKVVSLPEGWSRSATSSGAVPKCGSDQLTGKRTNCFWRFLVACSNAHQMCHYSEHCLADHWSEVNVTKS